MISQRSCCLIFALLNESMGHIDQVHNNRNEKEKAKRSACTSCGSSIPPQISSAANAACTSNSNVTYLVLCWPSWTLEEGDIAGFFCQENRTDASAENVSGPTTGLRRGQKQSGVSVGRKYLSPIFFRTSRFQVLQGMFVQSFAQMFEELKT